MLQIVINGEPTTNGHDKAWALRALGVDGRRTLHTARAVTIAVPSDSGDSETLVSAYYE